MKRPRRRLKSVSELLAAIEEYIRYQNEDPKSIVLFALSNIMNPLSYHMTGGGE